MDFTLQHDQPRGVKGSLKWQLSLQAALQWLIVVLLWRLSSSGPVGYPLPQWLAHLLMLSLALILTISSLRMWSILPSSYADVTLITLSHLQSTPFRIVLPLLCLLLSVPFFLGSFWWGNILIAIQAVLFSVLLYYREDGTETPQRNVSVPTLVLSLLAVGLIVRLLMALYGPINSDEAVYMEIAKHSAAGRGIWPAFAFLPENTVIRPGLGYALIVFGLWARVFGSGLVSIRMLNLVLGLCVLPFAYGTVSLWYGKRAALLTTAFVAISTVFLISSTARNNALPMLGVSIALFMHVIAVKRGSWMFHFAAGVSTLIALESHLLNAFFLVSLGGYYVVQYVSELWGSRKILPRASAIAFAFGVIVALAVYAFGHLFYGTEPQIFIAGMSPWSSRSGLLSNLAVLGDRVEAYWVTAPAESLLILVAVAAATIRRSDADRHWLTMMVFAAIGWLIVGGSGSLHYTTFGVPLYLAASGALFIDNEKVRQPAMVGVALVLTLFVVGYTLIMMRIRINEDAAISDIIDYVRQNVPLDAGLIAPLRIRPHLMDYEPYIITDSRDLLVAPVIANRDPDDYWIDVLLKTWPHAYIWTPYSEYDGVTVHAYDSYLTARHAEQVVEGAWVIPPTSLIEIDRSPFGNLGIEPAAYIEPVSPKSGRSIEIESLWVTRTDIARDYDLELRLTDSNHHMVWQSTQALISGWSKMPTSAWSAFEFHDVLLWVVLPEAGGDYLLTVTLINADCEGCLFTVPITVQ